MRGYLINLNCYLFLFGFLVINIINLIAIPNIHINSVYYRVFTLLISLIVLGFILLGDTKFTKIARGAIFNLYLVFSSLYLTRIFIDRFYYNINLEQGNEIIDMAISISYILIFPISLVTISKINQEKLLTFSYWITAILFSLSIVFNPLNFEELIQSRTSGFSNIGIQSVGLYAAVIISWSFIIILKDVILIQKIIASILLAPSLYFLALSTTRSAAVSSVIVLLVYLFNSRTVKFQRYLFVLLLIILIVYFLGPIISNWFEVLINRFRFGLENQTTGREYIQKIAVGMFIDSPILGNHHIIPGKAYFHNYFLDAFVSTGIVGGLIFTIINIWAVKKSVKFLSYNKSVTENFIASFFLINFIFGMFSGNLFSITSYWGSLMLLIIVNNQIDVSKVNRQKIDSKIENE